MLLAVKNTSIIHELEKQVSALTESLDVAENYNRRLNIQVIGIKPAFRSLTSGKDDEDRYVIVKGLLLGKNITLMNLCCPPGYSHNFLTKTFAAFCELSSLMIALWEETSTVILTLFWINSHQVHLTPLGKLEC